MAFVNPVSVPAFVNPHLFWIFEVENTQQRNQLQENLNENLKNPTRINAQQGELVVIFDNKTWKRAEVISVFEENYDCWLIDYGSLYKTTNVYKLPGKLTATPAMVRMACLNNIVETPTMLEIEDGTRSQQEVIHFSQGLSTLIYTLIFQADTVMFNTQRIIDHVLCGQMQLTKNGISYDLTERLLEEKRITINAELFKEAFTKNNRNVMHLRNYKIYEAQKKETPDVDQDIGIGRGFNRSIKSKNPGVRLSQPHKNFVQTWVEESNAQLVSNHKPSEVVTIAGKASTSAEQSSSSGGQKFQNKLTTSKFELKLNSEYTDSDELYEDIDETSINTSNPSKCRSQQSVTNSSSSFEDSEIKQIVARHKNTIKSDEACSVHSRPKSKLDHSLVLISDNYFKTIEDDLNVSLQQNHLANKSKLNYLHDSIDDDFFESVYDDKKVVKMKNESFGRDEIKSPDQKPSNEKSRTASEVNNPFSNSYEDSSSSSSAMDRKNQRNSEKTRNPSLISVNDGDLPKKNDVDKSETRPKSSISLKLPGFNLYPAGTSLSNSTRKRKTTSRYPSMPRNSINRKREHQVVGKSPKENESLNKSCTSSASTSSDFVLKNKTSQPAKETLSNATSDSECAQEPCKKNLFHFSCKCDNCRMWNEDDIAGESNKYKDSKNATRREIVRPSLLFKIENAEDAVVIKTRKPKENTLTKIERDMAPTLLVHGFCIPAAVSKVNEVPFNTNALRALTKLKFSSAKSIQSYAWPALMRHMNVCMVHGHDTGKTMAYLPAICSYILELSERYVNLPKTSGPVAIILCKGVKKVEETFSLFCNFRAQVRKMMHINWAASPLDNANLKSIQACSVLITTPAMLITLLKRRVITLKRLCHFVVEETDQVLSKFPQEFDDLMDVVQSMLKHRSCIYTVQIILCSEHWTVSLEKFIKKMCSVPLICIGAYLESALYGRADIQMHFVQSKLKLSMLCDILKEKSHFRRTVIVCNEEDEIDVVEEHLRIKGVSVTSVKSTMKPEEVFEVELMWENTVCGKHAALICTDALLHGQLSITDANVLVHYSLPANSWTQFSRRFKCLVNSFESPLNSKSSSDKCHVHVFVDETCNKQFPRLHDFLQSMGAKIPQKFSEVCKKIKDSKEYKKIELEMKLCPMLKLFGKCEKVSCKKRHLISKKDVSTKLPQNGLIKFKLMSVNDVSVYTIHLIEHTGADGKVHKYPDNFEFGAKLTQSVKENQMYVKEPKLGDLFAWFNVENNAFHRCEIIRVLSENKITKLADDVHIKLIDIGFVKKTTTALLFELPESYKTLPAQGIEVYLANLLPPDRDTEWSFNAKVKVEKMFKIAKYKNAGAYFTARVVLQLENTLWLEDVVLQEDLSFSNETVRKLLLKKSLLDNQLVSHRPEQLSHLYDLCKAAGITLCDYECKTTSKAVTYNIKQAKPQWAHLDEENLNAVYFCSGISPHLFYVRLEKFYSLFQKFQKELQSLIYQPHYPVVKEVVLGNCYLVKDPGTEEFCRAIVTEVQNETAECFFVDFGDGTCVFKNEVKHLPDAYITRLPFQAIECKLFGISSPMEVWPDEATDILYQYCFESKGDQGCDTKNDIFRTLYVSTLSAMKSSFNSCRNYSVLLIDYYSRKPVLINKILIDCGFALPEEDINLENITLPECQDYNDEQDDDDFLNIKDEENFVFNEVNGSEEITEKSPSPSENENVWDIEINDAEEFLKDFMGVNKKKNEKPTKKLQAPAEAYPIKALPPAKHHTPNLTWHQTDKHIKIDIKMPNVTDYSLHIVRKRIFIFSTTSENKEYKLNFQLYEDVEKTFQYSAGGPMIRVTLTKCNVIEWPRLTKSEQKFRHIKYDVSKCNLPEEKKRLFLEIDRNEKDDSDNDNYFVFGSDENYSESDIESDSSEN